MTKSVLIVCAHDDDEVIGLGGTIRRLADGGAEVTTLIMCSGNEGYQTVGEEDSIVARRESERGAAQAILGTRRCVAHRFGDFSNLDCEYVYREIMRVVRETRPCAVFSHLPGDYLPHRTLARVVGEAVWQASWRCSLVLGEPWRVDRLYQFPILQLVALPSHVIDITSTIEAKLTAMRAYSSQLTVVDDICAQIEAKARAYGSLVGVRYGEALVRSQSIPIAVAGPEALLDSLV